MRPADQIVDDLNKARELVKAAEVKVMALSAELAEVHSYVSDQLGISNMPAPLSASAYERTR